MFEVGSPSFGLPILRLQLPELLQGLALLLLLKLCQVCFLLPFLFYFGVDWLAHQLNLLLVVFPSLKVKKEFMLHEKVMERITKPSASKSKVKVEDSRKLATEPIDLDVGSPKSSSTIRPMKRK